MAALATVSDVAARWRPLTASEEEIVAVLLEDASDIVRIRFPDVDARLLAGTLAEATVVRIVANMVRRAMLNRDSEGITQGSEIVGPFQRSASYANPNGNLYLSAEELKAFEVDGYNPRVVQAWLA